MKQRIVLLPLLATMLLAMAPAAQAAVVGDIELVNATINANGVVRVFGEVTCPTGYDVTRTRASIDQQASMGGTIESRIKHFKAQVSCSGQPDRFVVRFFRGTEAEPFEPGQLTTVDLFFQACQPSPNGQCVSAEDISTVVF
jgi:hypothetical protein